jgi:hypothetical protein
MKCTAEMGSGAMIYTPNFIKTDSDILNFRRGGYTATQKA